MPTEYRLTVGRGVLAPHAKDRAKIVPAGNPPASTSAESDEAARAATRASRLAWAALLARVFAVDALTCPGCGGRMRIVAAITGRASVRRFLQGVGLPSDPPPTRSP
ncbi:MAG: hypothetical protein HY897_12965 [Deltaproteobacteria bacterium]|nr:hypothetical protein [Deltaproteobacteria bacterium]